MDSNITQTPEISVIIPIYNGGDTLFEVLAGFERQTVDRNRFEVLAVDDCSTSASTSASTSENTWTRLQEWAARTPLQVKLLQQAQNSGVSSTRNLGTQAARGEILLFVDQDCLPSPTLIERHLAAHQNNAGQKVAVAGKIIWSSEFSGTEAEEFYKGIYFPVWAEVDHADAPFYYFITSNASVSRQGLLEAGLFDAEFRHLYDDVIAGYKLQQNGFTFKLDESAIVYHHRALDLNEAIMRYRRMGLEMARVVRKYPELIGILTDPGELLVDSYVKQTLYRLLTQYATAQGLTEGLQREFPDKTLPQLLEQAALLKNFQTWKDRRLELYLSELDSLRKDKDQQLLYVRQLEKAHQHQRDQIKNLESENLDLAAYAVSLEQEQGIKLGTLARKLLSSKALARRAVTKIRHRLRS